MPTVTELPLTKESRLAVLAGVLFLLVVLLALLGERTLPLFGGNRELAARVYKSAFAVLGGSMAGLAAPFIVTTFTARLRTVLAAAGSDNPVASLLLANGVPHAANVVGFTLLVVFMLAGTVAAVLIWLKGS